MKALTKALCLFLLLGCGDIDSALAWQVTLGWDANPEPDLAGYYLYYTNVQGVYDYDGPPDATYNADAVTGLVIVGDGFHCWTLTAFDLTENESGPSNEACILLPDDWDFPPGKPEGFGIVDVQ